jgi:choline dehydrogenase-like flavoprotein
LKRQLCGPNHRLIQQSVGQRRDHDSWISDGSQFTTASAANPTLTIVALAIRQADYIADQMAKLRI